jgi:hypothetical protein
MPITEIIPYLLVIVVISLMLAPVVWMAPSPRDRQLAALRQRAILEGLRPELRERPAELPWVEQRQLMSYVLVASGREKDPTPRRCWVNQRGDWSGSPPVPPQLQELPAGVLLVELAGPVARAYWLEAGKPDDVARIRTVLAGLQSPTGTTPESDRSPSAG